MKCKYCGQQHYTVAEEIMCEQTHKEVNAMPKRDLKEAEKEAEEEEFEPVGGGEIFRFEEIGKTLTGKVLNIRDGQFKNKVYDIQIDDGSAVTVFGTTVLDRLMQSIQIGDIIRIKYVGDIPAKRKGMNPAKNFEVFRKKR
jgi:hypothetical protein